MTPGHSLIRIAALIGFTASLAGLAYESVATVQARFAAAPLVPARYSATCTAAAPGAQLFILTRSGRFEDIE